MKNYNDKLMLGYFDHDGKLHKVERLDKIPEIKGVISDEVQSPIPEYHEPPELSCTVECSDDFAREFHEQMKKLDLMILDAYDKLAIAFEHCTDNRDECGDCPFAGEENCRQKMRESVLHIIKSQRYLVERAIEEKGQDGAEGSL
jgi:hypothetical protein